MSQTPGSTVAAALSVPVEDVAEAILAAGALAELHAICATKTGR